MLGGHLYELIIVLIIALVVFGPKRLPELGSSLGKGIREFRKATNELQDSINVNHSEPLPPERPTTYTANTQTEYSAPTYSNPEYSAPAAQRPAAPGEYTAPPAPHAPATPVENQAPRA
jgi:sec-independent protein translocase protein TatA